MQAQNPLNILIVDDEPLARDRLRTLLSDLAVQLPSVVVGEAANGLQALDFLRDHPVDVVLADIRMPGMDGIELATHLGRLEKPPAVIFCTAYDNYAVQAFDLNAVDYLLKPVRAQRLAAALLKARQALPPAPQLLAELQQGARSHLSCHERGRLLLIPLADVIYLRADLKYVAARTREREYLLDESLVQLEREFCERFIRLHRSALVARDAIAGFERSAPDDAETQWQALLRGVPEKLPVSRRQWPLVKSYARQLSS